MTLADHNGRTNCPQCRTVAEECHTRIETIGDMLAVHIRDEEIEHARIEKIDRMLTDHIHDETTDFAYIKGRVSEMTWTQRGLFAVIALAAVKVVFFP